MSKYKLTEDDDEEKDVVHVVSPCHGKLYKTVSLKRV